MIAAIPLSADVMSSRPSMHNAAGIHFIPVSIKRVPVWTNQF